MTNPISNGHPVLPQTVWKRWAIACGSGAFLGIAAAAALSVGHRLLLGEPANNADKLLNLFFMMVAGAAEGTILAYFQYRLIGRLFPGISWKQWLAYTVGAAVIAWMLGMLPSLFLTGTGSAAPISPPDSFTYYGMAALMGLLLGALFGYFQWLPLKEQRRSALEWIPANALGWAAGMIFIFLGASLPGESPPWQLTLLSGAAGGLLAGLSVGAVTGYFLLRIHRSPEK